MKHLILLVLFSFSATAFADCKDVCFIRTHENFGPDKVDVMAPRAEAVQELWPGQGLQLLKDLESSGACRVNWEVVKRELVKLDQMDEDRVSNSIQKYTNETTTGCSPRALVETKETTCQ